MTNHTRTNRAIAQWQGAARARGFTLIELMVVVAIVAILASIAFASYEYAVTKSRRSAAAACLQERAQFMERFYTTNMSYVSRAPPNAAPVLPQCDAELQPFYSVAYAVTPTAAAPTAYTLSATPLASQLTNDTLCGTLTLTHQGVRGEGGTATTAEECW